MTNEPLRIVQRRAPPLPAVPTGLLGRTRELAEAQQKWAEEEFLEIVGAPGVGKTRFAIELAGQLAPQFDEVFWIPLQPVDESTRLSAYVARTMGLSARSMRHSDLMTALADRGHRTLVVLDNAEHVAAEVRRLLHAFAELPDVGVIVTSRTKLEHRQTLELSGLADEAAIELLRAFRTDDVESNPDELGEIVRRVAGLPLAIRLAAARLEVLTPQQFLEQSVAEDPLFDAIRRSWAPLSDVQRSVLGALSAFRGGAEPSALAEVAELALGDVVSAIQQLRRASMVEEELRDDRRRFGLLPTVAEFVRAELNTDRWRDRHAHFFADFARDARVEIRTASDDVCSRRLAAERPNMAAAAAWATTVGLYDTAAANVVGIAVAARLSGFTDDVYALGQRIWRKRDEVVAAEFFDEFAHMLVDDGRIELAEQVFDYVSTRAHTAMERMLVARGRARLEFRRGEMERGVDFADEAIAHARRVDEYQLAVSLRTWAAIAANAGRDDADEGLAEAAALFRELGAEHDRAICDYLRAWQCSVRRDSGALRGAARAAREVARRVGDVRLDLESAWLLGIDANDQGDTEVAEELLFEALDGGRHVGWPEQIRASAEALQYLYMERGDLDRAREMLAVQTRHANSSTEPAVRLWNQVNRAQLLIHEDELAAAADVLDEALAETVEHWNASLVVHGECSRALVRFILGDEARAERASERAQTLAETSVQRSWCELASAARACRASDAFAAGTLFEPLVPVRNGELPTHLNTSCARLYARIIERHLGPWAALYEEVCAAADHWVVDRDGGWFRTPAGEWVSLETRARLAAMLAALASQEPADVETLVSRVWQGEQMTADSARNRVRTTISMLRSEGLGDAITHDDDGYRLDRVTVH